MQLHTEMKGLITEGTIYSVRGRTRMARVDLGQPGAPLPWAAPQLSPLSFTEATWHVSFFALVELICVSVFARCHNTQASNSIHITSIMHMHPMELLRVDNNWSMQQSWLGWDQGRGQQTPSGIHYCMVNAYH